MNKLMKIVCDEKFKNKVTVHPRLLERMGLEHVKLSFFRFGHLSCEVLLYTSLELKEQEILISANVIDELQLPLLPHYEIKMNPYEIELGPFIGILACRKNEHLNNTVRFLTNYLYDYDEIGGAVIAFSAEGVNMDTQTIVGYLYNPLSKAWEHGTFAYPVSLFKRSGMSTMMRNHFHSILGTSIFNSYIFNKWEMHSWLSNFSELKSNLPETILYERPQDLIWFLQTFHQAYLKPIYGSQGVGIVQVSRIGDNYVFRYQEQGNPIEQICNTNKEAKALMKKLFKRRSFIIQQAISLLTVQDKVIDFRILLVKNQHGHWENYGTIARFGKSGSFLSNISGGGSAMLGEDACRNVLQFPEDKVHSFLSLMSQIAKDAAVSLEKCGLHLGNLGLDIAMDDNHKTWIIEINNKDPNHTIAIDAGDRQMFYSVKRANMLYAKVLAGFGKGQTK